MPKLASVFYIIVKKGSTLLIFLAFEIWLTSKIQSSLEYKLTQKCEKLKNDNLETTNFKDYKKYANLISEPI